VRVVVDSLHATGFQLRANDSAHVDVSVRRVESARAVLITNATICEATMGDPLDRPLTFSSTNEAVATARADGWVVGRGVGVVLITVSSDADVEPAEFPVQVVQ
jgi:hypothetical protein